jgi:hypothetical protein
VDGDGDVDLIFGAPYANVDEDEHREGMVVVLLNPFGD